MSQRLVMGLLALVTATGCATSEMRTASNNAQTNDGILVEQTDSRAPKVGDTVGLNDGRTPAQSAGQTRWFADSKAITVSPNGGTANLVLNPRQVQYYEEPYRYTCNMYTWGNATCEDYVCSGGGSGKSELWNRYYSAPGNQKATALNEALLGIGQGTAQKLHQAGTFRDKPRSWQDFRERMNRAVKDNVITGDQYREVFGTYGQQNRANLGYSGESCRTEFYTCQVWGIFPVVNGCEDVRIAERVINVFEKQVTVNIRNPQLQSFETENVVVSAGPDYQSIEILRADKTDYRVEKSQVGDGALFNLEGVGRFQVPLPTQALQQIQVNDARGQNMNAVVTVDPRFIGSGEDKLILTIQTTHCTPGGFWSIGDCKGDEEKAKVKEAPAYHSVTQAKASYALPAIPAGERVWITYSLHRENSKWYSNTPVGTKTDKLKELKK